VQRKDIDRGRENGKGRENRKESMRKQGAGDEKAGREA